MARVILTQPAPRVSTLAGRLRERGHDALELPLSRIVECIDSTPVRCVAARLHQFDWVILVSPAAIRAAARIDSLHWPASTGVAVVGPGSVQAIAECRLPIDLERVLYPRQPPYDAQALITLAPLDAPAGLRILVLRGAQGGDRWIERLRNGGATVETCALYRNEPLDIKDEAVEGLRAWLAGTAVPVLVVTQVASVTRLETLFAGAGLREAAHAWRVMAIHPRIVAALHDAGWADVREIAPGDRALELALESASDSSSPHGV